MNPSRICHLALILQTSPSTLESPARKAAESRSEWDFFWLLVSTAVVAAGILFEWPEVKEEFAKWLLARKVHLADRSRVPLWSLIGFLVVIIGVAGEGVFEGRLGIKDTEIRQIDETSLMKDELTIATLQHDNLVLQKQAGDAAKSSHNAAIDAKNAKDDSGEAKNLASDARRQSESVGKQTAAIVGKLETASTKLDAVARETGEAKAVLAQMNLEKAALEASLAKRIIPVLENSRTKETNIDSLKPFSGFTANIMCVPGIEPKRAAAEIASALRIAGWTIHPTDKVCTEKDENDVSDGVDVISWSVPGRIMDSDVNGGRQGLDDLTKQQELRWRSSRAANAIVCLLHKFGWVARADMGSDLPPEPQQSYLDVPSPDTINVYVLPHPDVYLDEKQEEAITAAAFAGDPKAQALMIKATRDRFQYETGHGDRGDLACLDAESK